MGSESNNESNNKSNNSVAREGLFSGSTDRVVGVAVILVSILAQLPSFDRSIVPMDEGHLASVAMWLQDGKLLYRDLHTGIFPGIYHATALLFSWFGNDLVVTRWAEVGVNATIGLCLWLAGSRMMVRGWALLAPALYLALIPVSFPVLAMFNYSSLALACSMASLYFLILFLGEGRISSAIGLGATLALAVLFKQNFGALAFVAALIGLISNRRSSALAARDWTGILWPIAISGVGVTLPFVIYFVAMGTFADFLHATVLQLGGDQLASFNNPIPPIFGSHPASDSRFTFLYSPPYLFNKLIHAEALFGLWMPAALQGLAIRLSYGLPLAVLVSGLALWFFEIGSPTAREKVSVRVVVVFALLFFVGIFPSAIWSHLAFVTPPVLLLLGLTAARCDAALRKRSATGSNALRIGAGSLIVCTTLIGVFASLDIARWHPTPLDLPRAHLKVTNDQAAIYRAAVEFIDACAPPGEAIFVAPSMPVVYFLTGRGNATRYDLTIPGDVEGERMIRALDASKTRCVVYNPVMYPEFPPFRKLFPDVYEYLKQNYRRTREIRGGAETWLGMQRKEERD